MHKSTNSSKVKALDIRPTHRSDTVVHPTNDEPILNPNRRKSFDRRKPKVGLSKPRRIFKIGTINCRTLQNDSAITELDKLLHDKFIDICCIQEHRFVHKDSDPDIVARDLGWSTLFTASAIRNDIGAAIHGVGIAINSKILPLLLSVKKVDEKIMCHIQRQP